MYSESGYGKYYGKGVRSMNIALIGNQNSGKTTLFNLLTGLNQKVGNWPGVTISKKVGYIKGTDHELVDLPGVYSLSPYSSEEAITRQYLLTETPDVIINIVDATSLERSLYLTTQLLELDTKVIVALNMADMVEKKGLKIDIAQLSKELGVPVLLISALKKTGYKELIQQLDHPIAEQEHKKIFEPSVEMAISQIANSLENKKHARFIATKIFERDKLLTDQITDTIESHIKKQEGSYQLDSEELIASQRYDFIVRVKQRCSTAVPVKTSISEKIDKVLLNRWAALPIFAMIMALIFILSVGVVGSFTVDFVDGNISAFGEWVNGQLESLGASGWAISLVCDGIITGVGAVLNFVPQLIILFLCISLLETSGYMSRIAFVLDRIFQKLGLSGKTLIPFIVGMGCSVPGIMATRTIEDEQERKMSILFTPFVPCSAKLPIIALFAGVLFPKYSGFVAASLYFMAVGVIIISALIMKKFKFKKSNSTFISELPEYRVPSPRYVARDVFEKVLEFFKRAGTIILTLSVIMWFLLSFSWSFQLVEDINDSILASIGNAFAWVFYPMLGEWSWAATVSAVQGLVAKEQVVGAMEVINGLASGSEGTDIIFGGAGLFSFFTGGTAYAFMIFNLFSAPCFGAIGAMRREFASKKDMFLAVLFQTGLAWFLATIVGLVSWVIF